jgi:hypothetical protein
VNPPQTTSQKGGGHWRWALFESVFPLDRFAVVANLAAGFSLVAMNIPKAMGYARIAGMPVITACTPCYCRSWLLLPLVRRVTW